MELGFYQELLLVVLSVLIAIIIKKIADAASGDGERPEGASTSADLPFSGEKPVREADEEIEAVADDSQTRVAPRGSNREIAGAEEGRGRELYLSEETGEEKKADTDEVGEKEDGDETRNKMPELLCTEKDDTHDFEDEEEKAEEKETGTSSFEVNIDCGKGVEISNGSGEEGSIENKGRSFEEKLDGGEGAEISGGKGEEGSTESKSGSSEVRVDDGEVTEIDSGRGEEGSIEDKGESSEVKVDGGEGAEICSGRGVDINIESKGGLSEVKVDGVEGVEIGSERGEYGSIGNKWGLFGVKVDGGEGAEMGNGRGGDVSIENMGGSLLHGEDEWVGIERSEIEKLFVVAAEYVVSSSGVEALAQLSSDVQMALYALHKVAAEGPCFESKPLPLRVSAWARWHAWQKLGSMTPEIAMERYISLLSKNIPGWTVQNSGEDVKDNGGSDAPGRELLNTGRPDFNSSLQSQVSPVIVRKLQDQASTETESASGGSIVLQQGLTGTFLLNLLFPTGGTLLSFYW